MLPEEAGSKFPRILVMLVPHLEDPSWVILGSQSKQKAAWQPVLRKKDKSSFIWGQAFHSVKQGFPASENYLHHVFIVVLWHQELLRPMDFEISHLVPNRQQERYLSLHFPSGCWYLDVGVNLEKQDKCIIFHNGGEDVLCFLFFFFFVFTQNIVWRESRMSVRWMDFFVIISSENELSHFFKCPKT